MTHRESAPNQNVGPQSDAPSPERFALTVPSPPPSRFGVTLVLTIALLLMLLFRAEGEHQADFLVGIALLVVLIPVVVLFALSYLRPSRALIIELLPDRLVLPASGKGRLSVRFKEITALFLQRRGSTAFLYIGTDAHDFVFPVRAFSAAPEAERLLASIRTRIQGHLPDGALRLAGFDRAVKVAERGFERSPWVIWSASGIILFIHGWLILSGRLLKELDVAMLGAVSPQLVSIAGPYLAMTANWVHGWLFQPVLVIALFFIVGKPVERLLGHFTTAAILLSGATLGGLMAAYFPGSPLYMGSYAPAIALVACLAFTAQRYAERMPIGFNMGSQWWGWVLALVGVSIFLHGVSIPALLGGCLAGVLVTGFALQNDPEVPLVTAPSWSIKLVPVLLSVHLAAGFWAYADLPQHSYKLQKIAVENLDDPQRLKDFSIQVVVDENSDRASLELAETAITRAVRLSTFATQRLTFQNIKSWVLFKSGKLSEAIVLQRDVLERDVKSLRSAALLAKFIAGYEDSAIVPEEWSDLLSDLTASLRIENKEVFIDINSSTKELPDDIYVYAVLENEDDTFGLLRIPLLMEDNNLSSVKVELDVDQIKDKDGLQIKTGLIVAGRASSRYWSTENVLPDNLF